MPALARQLQQGETQRGSLLKFVKGGQYAHRDGWKANRKELLATWAGLMYERSTWDPHWAEIGRYVLPRSPRWFIDDRNKGHKRHNNIYNDAATRAVRVMAAGMMAGASSRARPWFGITTSDPALAKYHPVQLWLEEVSNLLRRVFESSNTYTSLHSMYEQLATFGTACNVVMGDFDTVLHHYPSPIGEFALAQDFKGRICTVFRRYQMTVRELVEQFGLENCSKRVQEQFEKKRLEDPVEVLNAIERRADRNPEKRDNLNMPWRSVWLETAGDENEVQVLRESGFSRFPALVPRWQVEGRDVYGGSPGMDALGQIKGLQLREISQAKAIEYGVEPSLQVPTSFKGQRVNMLPGGQSFVDSINPNSGIRPSWEVNINLAHMRQDIHEVEARIDETFFKDLFLMVSNSSDTTQRTAAEIAERKEEKLVMIGPGYGRMQDEALAPLLALAFAELSEKGVLPPAPPELEGQELKVEFISVLALAQKLIGLAGHDRFLVTLDMIVKMGKPEVLDRFDADGWIDNVSGVLVPASMIISREKADQLRDARNRMMAAEKQAALMNQASGTVKNLATAPTGGAQTALADVTSGLMGYSGGG